MTLHDQLERSLDRIDDGGPDLAHLAAVARRRGARVRRRRTAGGVAGAAAAIAVAGVMAVGLGLPRSGGLPSAARPAADPIPTVTPDLAGPRAAMTGPAAVLALDWAVTRQRAGAAYEPAGQLSRTSGDLYAELLWQDADGRGASVVGLNLQHGRGMFSGCGPAHPEKLGCAVRRLPDGSRLVTYREEERVADGVGRRVVADLLRPGRVRVVATASNGIEHAGGRWTLTRTAPPLTTSDLVALVRQPVWRDTVPVAFTDAGADLAGYDDLDDHGGWVRGSLRP